MRLVALLALVLAACTSPRAADVETTTDAGADAGPDASMRAPEPVGGPCETSADCRAIPSAAWCLTEADAMRLGLSAPGGYCTSPACNIANPPASCGLGTICGTLGAATPGDYCEVACATSGDCRAGFECVEGGCAPHSTVERDAGPPDAGPPDAGPIDAGAPDAGPCNGPCPIEAAITAVNNEPARFPFDLFGQSVFAGTVVAAPLSDSYSDYEVPGCSGLGCCGYQYFGYSIARQVTTPGSAYTLHITGGTKGPSYVYGYIQLQSPWHITGTSGSLGDGATSGTVSANSTRLDFSAGLSSGVCNCSDCGRANYWVSISR